jgi:dihydropyrimidinase
MKTLIKNGRIVTAVDDYRADILIDGETVSLIGARLDMQADRVIDAAGRLVIPGGIDPHTHLDMPFGGTTSADDFATGTIAAAHGGTTCVIDFATQARGESILKALDTWHKKAAGKAAIDYSFHMIVTDLTPKDNLSEMRQLLQHEGVLSFKLFMAYPNVLLSDDATIFKAMQLAGENGGFVSMHAENGIVINEIVARALAEGKTAPRWHAHTRPTLAEAEAVHRSICLAKMAGTPVYIVHLSSSDALREIQKARGSGIPIFAETCPQYLFLDLSMYDREGFEGAKFVMTPPLREKWNQEELWTGLKLDDIQLTATDHCPFRFKDQKRMGLNDFTKIPNGGPGIEDRMSLIYNGGVKEGRINLNRFVEITSTAAAKIFGLFPKKGTIAVGSDADIVIFNPDKKMTISAKTHHMNVDYNCYEGLEVTGVSETVLSRGKVIIEDGRFVGKSGDGNFLKRSNIDQALKPMATAGCKP